MWVPNFRSYGRKTKILKIAAILKNAVINDENTTFLVFLAFLWFKWYNLRFIVTKRIILTFWPKGPPWLQQNTNWPIGKYPSILVTRSYDNEIEWTAPSNTTQPISNWTSAGKYETAIVKKFQPPQATRKTSMVTRKWPYYSAKQAHQLVSLSTSMVLRVCLWNKIILLCTISIDERGVCGESINYLMVDTSPLFFYCSHGNLPNTLHCVKS